MKPSVLWMALATVVSTAVASPVQAHEFSGIGRAVDGDSLFVGAQEVRLFGIDAPEYRQTCLVGWSSWSCGSDAAAALRALVNERQLTCMSVDRDVYGRTVAKCEVDGVDLGAAMLDKGLAVALGNASADYLARQIRSKAGQGGIWASKFEMPAAYRAANPRVASSPARRTAPQATMQAPIRAVAAARSVGGAFRNCAEARAAGAAPVRAGQPGYGPHLDRDGVACEPYRKR